MRMLPLLDANAASSRRTAGYTLLELLLVVAVVAILSAMLLGGLRTVRAVAESVQCQVSLRQFGLAHQAYAQDWRGRICPTGLHGIADQLNWSRVLMQYMQEEQATDVVMSQDGIERRNALVYTCRAALRQYRTNWPHQQTLAAWNYDQRQWRMHSYGQNLFPLAPESLVSTVIGYNAKGQGSGQVRWSQVTHQTRRVLNTESWYSYLTAVHPIPYDMRWAFPGSGTPVRHRNGNNSLFFDLSVRALPREVVMQSTVDPAQVRL